MEHTLIVHRDPANALFLAAALREHGFVVETADVKRAVVRLRTRRALVAIVVDSLSAHDALRICTEARSAAGPRDACIVLLLPSNDVVLKLAAFEAGADDVLVKPVDIRELVARLRAARRRRGSSRPDELHGGGIRMDLVTMRVWVGDTAVKLTATEFMLLAYLMLHSPRPIPRSELAAALADVHHDTGTNFLDTRVCRLCKKLGAAAACHIKPVRGVGYVFDCEPRTSATER